jgi:hypothetical protein
MDGRHLGSSARVRSRAHATVRALNMRLVSASGLRPGWNTWHLEKRTTSATGKTSSSDALLRSSRERR